MATDYKVRNRSYAEIAQVASDLRVRLNIDHCYTFNLVRQVRKMIGRSFGRLGFLKLELFENRESKAYVTFDPLILHVHKQVWEEAEIEDPKARFILAHELGHIVMHGYYRQDFAEIDECRLKAFPTEERAEAQANWLASAFLAPDYLAKKCENESELCLNFDFPREYIEQKRHLFITPPHKNYWLAR